MSLLVNCGMDKTSQIAVMLLIKEDEEAQKDLFLWMFHNKPTAQEVMGNWVAGYLRVKSET